MLESLINPRKAERKPWEMSLIGFVYAALSIILCIWLFSENSVLSEYIGVFIVMFCVIFSTPFIYYTIKLEERKDLEYDEESTLLKEHGKAMLSFLFLFLGFILAFSIGYTNPNMLAFVLIFLVPLVISTYKLLSSFFTPEENGKKYIYLIWIIAIVWLIFGLFCGLPFFNNNSTFGLSSEGPNLFRVQIQTFCQINNGGDYDKCLEQYGLSSNPRITGAATSIERTISIFSNNIYVLIFTLVLSLIFGAGAIFILAWNASVIATAIGIFAKNQLANLHLGFARYILFHGLLEIAAYFIAALAGGILSTAFIKHDTKSEKFWTIVQDALNLIIIAIVILIIAALIEVFITPKLF